MDINGSVFVAGHRGLVGSDIHRRLSEEGFTRILTASRSETDLRDAAQVDAFFAKHRPDYVFLAAAKVGGILANATYPVDFLQDNLAIQCNVFAAAHRHGAKKVEFLGSSCIYPKMAPQPLKEEYLLTGPLEPTNEWYAIAKIAGIKLGQAYRRQYGMRVISLMPTNLYGPNDNFDLQSSHVLPALLRKFHEAKLAGAPAVNVWGSGKPMREFLHVDDLADAAVFLMRRYEGEEIINVGTGTDISIAGLADLLLAVVGYQGVIEYDIGKPDGTPRKLMDVGRLSELGWKARIPLSEGVASTYAWYLANRAGKDESLS